MTLNHSDIYWCSRSKENVIIVDHYGEFPNVPLLGITGGITYNPCLALRQFGYARRDGPRDALVQGIAFDYESDVQCYCQRCIRAWGMVKKKLISRLWGIKNPFLWSLISSRCELALKTS